MTAAAKMKAETEAAAPVILCVDDEENLLLLRKMVLAGAGYNVLAASNAAEALALFAANPVDLVITDHLMVRESGTQLSRRIKEIRPNVPVAILSGLVDPPDDMDAADVFIPKTAGPTELLSIVARLLKL